MKIEIASIPSTKSDTILGFVQGAKAIVAHIPNPDGNDPMCIDLEFRASGNCHIYLITGRWIGPHQAEFPEQEISNEDHSNNS